MASATVNSAAATDGGLIRLDAIPIVDIRLLSQSELYSLSRCSSSSSDPNRRDDVVVPIIDRSVFNESSGSRKQTYSRLRLAPSNSSSSAAPRGRPHHLRSAGASYGAINRKSDPENAEDYQIINLLKQLFVADMDPGELFPVKIEYSNSLPAVQFTSPPPSSPSNVGPMGLKRKRGRPRKNDILGNVENLAVEVSVVDASDIDGFPIPSLNQIVARDIVDEADREVLNSDGVAVDLAALGAVEHPYKEEIQRRTEGLRTEEELLGFLTGLNGKWGSRRKKRRIVDAGEFGSKLPVGWKLLLSVKKKNGFVWLYCRRYISPSGLHFVSCKGVSSYLLSLHGVHGINQHSSAQYNDIFSDADKLISVPVAIQDGNEIENLVSCAPSPHSDSATDYHEIQVVVNEGDLDLQEDRIGESLFCNKCNIAFNDKDEFLQHQSSLHWENRNKNVARLTDGVIIKDGKHECQFCHKTFSERHRYNGHVGTHVRFQERTAGESSESAHLSSLNEFPTRDIAMGGSSKSHNPTKVCNSIKNNGSIICALLNTNGEHFEDSEEASGNMTVTVKASDIVTETNPCSAAEGLFSSKENKSFYEDAYPNDSALETIDRSSTLQDKRLESSLPHNDAADSDMNGCLIDNSAAPEKPNQTIVPESCLFDCNDHVEECLLVNNNKHKNDDSTDQTRNELKLDSQKLAVNGSVFANFGIQENQEKLTVTIEEQSDWGDYVPCKNIDTTESISTSGLEASKHVKDPTISLRLIADDEKAHREDNAPYSSVECKVDGTLSFGKCEKESSQADNDYGLKRHEEMKFGIASVIQSWNEQENASKKGETEVFTHLLEVPRVQDMSKCQLVADVESMYHYEKSDGGVCVRETKVPELDSLQNFGNGQSSDLFSSSAGLSTNPIPGTELDTTLGVCSPFISTTDKQLPVEDNMMTMFKNTMEERRQDPSEVLLVDQPGVSGVPDKAYMSNKIYNSPANPFSRIENAGKHELSLSFGSLHTDLCIQSSNRVKQESYQANSFDVNSVVPKTYGDLTHSSILSSNMGANLEHNSPFGYPSLSFHGRTHEPDNSFDVAHPEQDWVQTERNKLRASSHNFMIGFGNNSLQTNESVAANGSWRTDQDNVYGGCFDANSGAHIPSSGCLPTCSLAPDKDEESSFNYGAQSEMMRPGRTQPVEYSFMGDECGEAKVFPSVCVWCRNVFFDEAGMQTGAICQSCSSNIPGHFNVL